MPVSGLHWEMRLKFLAPLLGLNLLPFITVRKNNTQCICVCMCVYTQGSSIKTHSFPCFTRACFRLVLTITFEKNQSCEPELKTSVWVSKRAVVSHLSWSCLLYALNYHGISSKWTCCLLLSSHLPKRVSLWTSLWTALTAGRDSDRASLAA